MILNKSTNDYNFSNIQSYFCFVTTVNFQYQTLIHMVL